jgi:hypothetical protein
MHTEFWSENLKIRDNFEVIGIDGKILVKLHLKN